MTKLVKINQSDCSTDGPILSNIAWTGGYIEWFHVTTKFMALSSTKINLGFLFSRNFFSYILLDVGRV